MKLISTQKLYTFHDIFLGVPPVIENKRCISVERSNELDIFEYCDDNEPLDLTKINNVFFAKN